MKKIGYCIFFGIVASLLFSSCTDTSTDKPVSDLDSIMSDTLKNALNSDTLVIKKDPNMLFALSSTDKAILNLLDKIEIGYSFNNVRVKYPLVKGIRPEEKKDVLATAGLTESVCKQPIFGGVAAAEFNYKNDSIYSYYFTYSDKNFKKTEQIFYSIMDYYSEKWGEPNPEGVEEENHYSQNYIWPSKRKSVFFVNYNINTGLIVWGKRTERVL